MSNFRFSLFSLFRLSYFVFIAQAAGYGGVLVETVGVGQSEPDAFTLFPFHVAF
jgi:putative protein kinase ArgK-like GTPase of G3E family